MRNQVQHIIIHAFVFLFVLTVKAQIPSVPTPTVSAVNFGKFADIEPNLYNGSLSIPIPLASLSKGTVSTSVGINYHTAGIRAAELASEVGLGWHLNAGGAITRQIKGLDDFSGFGWLETGDEIQQSGPNASSALIDKIKDQKVDPEPDIFTYQVGGMSGKFYFNDFGGIETIPSNDILIEYVEDSYIIFSGGLPFTVNYEYFVITDMNGTKYYLGSKLNADGTSHIENIETSSSTGLYYESSWFLYKVESFDAHHVIDFEYADNEYAYYSIGDCGFEHAESDCDMTLTKILIRTKVLSKITAATGEIDFIYATRSDLPKRTTSSPIAKSLYSINVKKGGKTKTIQFDHDYFSDYSGDGIFPDQFVANILPSADKDFLRKRLKLNGISIRGAGTTNQDYGFEYYGLNGTSNDSYFPTSVTLNYDHWGFHNHWDHSSRNNIIPYTCIGGDCAGSTSVNRDSDFDHMIAGSLQKVTYPTGAHSLYEYAANNYGTSNTVCGGLRVEKITTDENNSPNTIREFNYENGTLYQEPTYAGTNGIYLTQTFFNSRGFRLLGNFDGYHIGYPEVEIDYNGNGTKVLKYHTEVAPPPQNSYPPVTDNYRNDGGAMKSSETKAEDGTQLSLDETTLENLGLQFSSVRMLAIDFFDNPAQSGATWHPNQLYQIKQRIRRPEMSIHTVEGIETSTEYYYTPGVTYAPFETETYDQNGISISFERTQFTSLYFGDNSAAVSPYFANRNINIPWRKVSRLNNQAISETKTHYRNYFVDLFNYYPGRIEKIFNDPNNINPSITRETTFNSYDQGLITSITDFGAQENLTFEYDLSTALLKKSCFGELADPNALCKSYAYHGTSSLLHTKTEVDGTVTTYDYDNQLRLSSITNDVGAISTNVYHVSPNASYIKTTIDYPTPTSLSALDIVESKQILDGLGRPIQTIGMGQAFSGNDQLIGSVEYDEQGRVFKNYETFESGSSTGNYVDPAGSSEPFTLITYEDSPLNRVSETLMPDWNNRSSKLFYGTNSTNITAADGSNYPVGELFQRTQEDPDGKQIISFSDVRGRQILKRRTDSAGSGISDTYYDYDKKNRLTEIIPPGSSAGDNILNFFSEYDNVDNIIRKKIPSTDWVDQVFDDRDLLIGYQDGHLRNLATPVWYGYTYDDFGRETHSGFFNSMPSNPATNPDDVLTQVIFNNSGTGKGKVGFSTSKLLGQGMSGSISASTLYDIHGRVSSVAFNDIVNGAGNNSIINIKL